MIVCDRSKQHLKAVETLRAELEEEEQALDGSEGSGAVSLPAADSDTDDVGVAVEPPHQLHHPESEIVQDAEAAESEQHAAGHQPPPSPMCKLLASLKNACCDLSGHNKTFCALCLKHND